jgi:hypothetical protein
MRYHPQVNFIAMTIRGTQISDSDLGKKQVEEMDLEPFLDEYEHVTGTRMTVVTPSERPDFICERKGRLVGVELVRAMENPVQRDWRIILGDQEQFEGSDAAMLIQEAVYQKEEKRASIGWKYPDHTILVVQLIGGDGKDAATYLDSELMDEMSSTGFKEIWVADYSPISPYGTVQLVGVKPKRWRGLHPHRFYGTKPYG